MLSRLSKLATKRILRNVKCKKVGLLRRSGRTYFTSLQHAQQHATRLTQALRLSKDNDLKEANKMVSDNIHYNISNVVLKNKEQFFGMFEHLTQVGTVAQNISQVFCYSPYSYVAHFMVRYIDNNNNREAINSGVSLIAVNDEGKVIAMGAHDTSSLGPMDDIMELPSWEGEKPFFDSIEKAQQFLRSASIAFEKDMNDKALVDGGVNSPFYNEYFADDSTHITANVIFDGAKVLADANLGSLASKSVRFNTNLQSFGPYSIYAPFQWSHIYNDDTHGSFSGEHMIFVNNEGKIQTAYTIFDQESQEAHVKKVTEILQG